MRARFLESLGSIGQYASQSAWLTWIGVLLCLPVCSAAQPTETIESIQAVVFERLAATRSFEVEFEKNTTVFRETILEIESDPATGLPKELGWENPPTDLVLLGRSRVLFDGFRLRKDVVDDLWNSSERRIVPEGLEFTAVYSQGGSLNYDRKDGRAWAESAPQPFEDRLLRPITNSLVMDFLAEPGMTILRTEIQEGLKVVVVGNTDYLSNTETFGAIRREFYLDPTRAYIPVGYCLMEPDGRVFLTSTTHYRVDATYGHLPAGGTMTEMDHRPSPTPQKVMRHCSIKVTKLLINPPMNEASFRMNFPPGTEFTDRVSGSTFVVGALPWPEFHEFRERLTR